MVGTLKNPLQNSILSLPDRLRQERKRIHLTQEEFGRLGGVTKTAQWLYESGRNWPTTEYLESLRLNDIDVGFIATGIRLSNDRLDWVILKNAFLLIQHSFAERTDLNFSAEQLFDAFKSVVEASMGVTRPDLVQEPNKLMEKLGE
jgi:transcriptional regulator with XRE-family HTH domain